MLSVFFHPIGSKTVEFLMGTPGIVTRAGFSWSHSTELSTPCVCSTAAQRSFRACSLRLQSGSRELIEMPNLSRFAWLAIASNIFFSVILVLLNKRLVVTFGFTYMTVLSGLHFAASFIVCMLMICIKAQKYKAVNSYWSIFRISLVRIVSFQMASCESLHIFAASSFRDLCCPWYS